MNKSVQRRTKWGCVGHFRDREGGKGRRNSRKKDESGLSGDDADPAGEAGGVPPFPAEARGPGRTIMMLRVTFPTSSEQSPPPIWPIVHLSAPMIVSGKKKGRQNPRRKGDKTTKVKREALVILI